VANRLISADSHVRVELAAVRERVPVPLRPAFDDAIAMQAASEKELKGGKELDLSDWDMEAFRDPGYSDPVARLAAMDRDGVQAEVLYSEVSAFRHFGLVKGDWKPISRAFTDHLSEFAAVDPDRLAVSYQVPIIDVDYAVSEVLRLAGLGARSVHLPNFPSELGLPDYHEPVYDPLWAALSETDIAISHHLGTPPHLYKVFQRDPTPQCGIFTSLPALALAEVISWWILTGTLERFPKLKIVFVEPSL
jgi:predicted TIM-barrel fold metal-dependent hydrolase